MGRITQQGERTHGQVCPKSGLKKADLVPLLKRGARLRPGRVVLTWTIELGQERRPACGKSVWALKKALVEDADGCLVLRRDVTVTSHTAARLAPKRKGAGRPAIPGRRKGVALVLRGRALKVVEAEARATGATLSQAVVALLEKGS